MHTIPVYKVDWIPVGVAVAVVETEFANSIPNAVDSSGMQQSIPQSSGQQPNLTVVYRSISPYSSNITYADYEANQYETLTPGYSGQYLIIPRIVDTPYGFIDTSRIGEYGYIYPVYLLSFNGQCLDPALFEPGPVSNLTVINLRSTTESSAENNRHR
ncbi:MAG: hypothetical protein HC838_17840 [Spirulinaceae cyanobacterium RM2_2_10]|nr:hypothetical protein [Spirulinaceae cyanobacterium RM2_2_10]